MKIKVMNWMLMAIVVFGLGMCVISCSDDDDNSGKSEEQKEQEAQQKASKFWDVVGQLVADDETEDYATKTFEPTYGNADPNDPQTRIVNTNDLKTAAKRFANLVGTTKVDENTQTYTYRDDEVGELIYTKGDGTTAWATVDVRIKQVPHLSRIIYRKAGEGENRSFSGKAYYRFGDVVKRTVQIKNTTKNPDNRQSVDEYWICVRPAFGPEGKEDSHWVCVNTVANNNVKYYRSSDKKDYWLPTNLKENREHMQNFAELLYAICNPTQWYNNANNFHVDGRLWGFDGVPIFHDFTKNNLCFHNDLFWKNVQEAWKTKEIAKNAMLLPSFSALSALVNSKDGIHLLYKGYSWWFSSSWNCELWEAIYTNGDTNEEKNMHHEKINDGIEHSMQGITFDCRTMGNYTSNYMGFFDNDANFRWTIRHAKGEELDQDGYCDVDQPIDGVTEVYRYYSAYKTEAKKPGRDDKDGPEITEAINPNITYEHRGFWNIGDVVKDDKGNRWFCVQPSCYKSDYVDVGPNYSYFISFDKVAVGSNLENIPKTKNLTIQMLFSLGSLMHNYAAQGKRSIDIVKNIKDYAGVNINEIVGLRDTLHKHTTFESLEKNDFCSTLYREDGQLYVLRHFGDYTIEFNGQREWDRQFWTYYSKTEPAKRKMLLSDLADQNIINQYNQDKWVHLTWYDQANLKSINTNTGVRTQTEPITPLSRFTYQMGYAFPWDTKTPSNMYREPIYVFAVKRVEDLGSRRDTFEDGTSFEPVRMMKDVNPDIYGDDITNYDLGLTVDFYKQSINIGNLTLDGQSYHFGLDNKP